MQILDSTREHFILKRHMLANVKLSAQRFEMKTTKQDLNMDKYLEG